MKIGIYIFNRTHNCYIIGKQIPSDTDSHDDQNDQHQQKLLEQLLKQLQMMDTNGTERYSVRRKNG